MRTLAACLAVALAALTGCAALQSRPDEDKEVIAAAVDETATGAWTSIVTANPEVAVASPLALAAILTLRALIRGRRKEPTT